MSKLDNPFITFETLTVDTPPRPTMLREPATARGTQSNNSLPLVQRTETCCTEWISHTALLKCLTR